MMMGMLHYTIWGNKPETSYKESLNVLMDSNNDIVLELLEIAEYNLKHYKVVEIPYEDVEVPLELYASYGKEQIMAAFGVTNESHMYHIRGIIPFRWFGRWIILFLRGLLWSLSLRWVDSK